MCIYLLLNQCDQSYSSLHRVIYVLTEVYFDLYIMKHTDIPDYINIQTIFFLKMSVNMANIEKFCFGLAEGGALNILYDRIYLQVILIYFMNGIFFSK